MATRDTFYEVTVEFEVVSGNGKAKTLKEYYLVLADSVTYAEAQVAKVLADEKGAEWTVTGAKKSKVTLVETESVKV